MKIKERATWIKKRMEGFWILVIVFGIIIILSILAIFLIYWLRHPSKDTIGFEIQKALLQILTVLVLGQVISLVVAQFNYNRQKAEARTEFQKDILKRLIRSYIDTKKHRRLLRAKGLNPPYDGEIKEGTVMRFDAYEAQMQLINETELEIEAIRHEVEATEGTFSDSNLADYIQVMEDYLRLLIQVYEQKHNTFQGDPPILALKELKLDEKPSEDTEKPPKPEYHLSDFVGVTEDSLFSVAFINSYYIASKAIRKDILGESTNEKT